jgi:raffinose/stachyose/melibiose transport system substrate-binding protein
VLAVAVFATFVVAACGGGNSGSGGQPANANGPVTLTWWHNGTTDPLKSVWEQTATSFHRAHPSVTIKVDPIQNEQFTTKVPVALQSSRPPDVYQQWGGGQEATQIRSGKLMDITDATKGWIGTIGKAADGWKANGRQYGVPYDLHIVGFWYRKDLFARAGINAAPTTVAELEADVAKLKKAGIVPIAIGSKDRWPDAFWWEYFAVRECPIAVLQQSIKAVQFNDPCFAKTGQDTKAFMAIKPFQSGFLGTPAQEGAGSSAGMVANGKAAMELQGDWEPSVMAALTQPERGARRRRRVLVHDRGHDGLRGLPALHRQPARPAQLVTSGAASLPANPRAASAITNPTVKKVLQYSQNASFIQTYFDIALPTSPGQALDDAVADFFAGKGSPDTITMSVTE